MFPQDDTKIWDDYENMFSNKPYHEEHKQEFKMIQDTINESTGKIKDED